MNWTQPHAGRSNYWESDKYDFWVTRKTIYSPVTGLTSARWLLFNGDLELGVYDSLAEAQNAAEPAHGVHEDKESEPICFWCGQTHPDVICRHSGYYVEGAK